MKGAALKYYSETGKTQADGAVEVLLTDCQAYGRHQIKLAVDGQPAAGTLSVYAKSPGAPEYDYIGAFDMTDTTARILRASVNAEALKFVPASFDAAKTYSIYGIVYEH